MPTLRTSKTLKVEPTLISRRFDKTELYDLVGFNPDLEVVNGFAKNLIYNFLNESAFSNADCGLKINLEVW